MSRGPGKWQLVILRALRRPGIFPLQGRTADETAALLRAASVDCVVLETETREFIEQRPRAGVIEEWAVRGQSVALV